MRKLIFGMSHVLTNIALALPPFTENAEVWHQRLWKIEKHPVQKKGEISSFKLTDSNGDFIIYSHTGASIGSNSMSSNSFWCLLFQLQNLHLALLHLFLAVTENENWIWKTRQMNYRGFELKPGQLLGRQLCSQEYQQNSRDSLWPGTIDKSIHILTVIAGDSKKMSSKKWLVGLGVWFSLRVREVPGSNPERAL